MPAVPCSDHDDERSADQSELSHDRSCVLPFESDRHTSGLDSRAALGIIVYTAYPTFLSKFWRVPESTLATKSPQVILNKGDIAHCAYFRTASGMGPFFTFFFQSLTRGIFKTVRVYVAIPLKL